MAFNYQFAGSERFRSDWERPSMCWSMSSMTSDSDSFDLTQNDKKLWSRYKWREWDQTWIECRGRVRSIWSERTNLDYTIERLVDSSRLCRRIRGSRLHCSDNCKQRFALKSGFEISVQQVCEVSTEIDILLKNPINRCRTIRLANNTWALANWLSN